MEYNQSMNLQSPSGYAMPFEADERAGLNIVANYGEQKDAEGKEYFNHGIDFKLQPGTWLKAMATGVVTGISSDFKRGFSLMVNYPNYANGRKSAYDVTYYGISRSLSTFGKNVKAGDNIAVCDDTLHIEVRFNGEEMNPVDFLTMMRDNMLVADQVQAREQETMTILLRWTLMFALRMTISKARYISLWTSSSEAISATSFGNAIMFPRIRSRDCVLPSRKGFLEDCSLSIPLHS